MKYNFDELNVILAMFNSGRSHPRNLQFLKVDRTEIEKQFPDSTEDELDNCFVFDLCGGNNGNAEWRNYLWEIGDILNYLQNVYGKDNVRIASETTDLCDDIYYCRFIVYKTDDEFPGVCKCEKECDEVCEDSPCEEASW